MPKSFIVGRSTLVSTVKKFQETNGTKKMLHSMSGKEDGAYKGL